MAKLDKTIQTTIDFLKAKLRGLIRSIKIASTGSCYVKVITRDGVKVLRIADHKAGCRGGQNWLDIRSDREEYFGGKVYPCNQIESVVNKVLALA